MTISQSFVPPPPVLGLVSRTRPVSASSPAVFGSGPHNITPGCGTVSQQDSQIGYFSSDCSNGHTHPDYSVCLCVCVCLRFLIMIMLSRTAQCVDCHTLFLHTLGSARAQECRWRQEKQKKALLIPNRSQIWSKQGESAELTLWLPLFGQHAL